MHVGEVMTRRIITISPGRKARDALELMSQKMIAHLPVIEKSKLVGIITDRDLRLAVIPQNKSKTGKRISGNPLERRVKDVMTRKVVSVDPGTGVADAVKMMLRLRIGSLPVAVDGKLKGIITKDDLLVVFVEMLRMIQSSSTIDVELADEIDDMDVIQTTLKSHNIKILSCAATPGKKSGSQICHVRLEPCPVKDIVHDLTENGVKVLDAFGEDT
ncbi:hypothetical protein MNBD_NITROSPINAE02-887 [hydrothermal vent metagenome]|uniref:CBS domain-containing protein n=1 Tax=hydrothermal vent metagenome TaxID=652676 RepID=A0A3B1C8X8_9ZZZZ